MGNPGSAGVAAGRDPVARAAGETALRLVRRSREQCDRGLHPWPAQEAGPADRDQCARPGLHGWQDMMRSLRVRLLLLLGAEIIVAAVIQFATSYGAARHEAN